MRKGDLMQSLPNYIVATFSSGRGRLLRSGRTQFTDGRQNVEFPPRPSTTNLRLCPAKRSGFFWQFLLLSRFFILFISHFWLDICNGDVSVRWCV